MAMAQLHDDTSNNAASMNKQRTIRIMVLGDEKVGKSSLISALVSQHASERVPRVLHDIVIPTEDTRDNVVISLHDTSSSSNDVMEVIKTMNRSDAAIVVYDVSRSISSQRLGYWLDLLKVTKVVPVVLVGNKSDLLPGGSEISRVQSVLRNYKFIVHTLECSARTLTNVKKTFGLAQKAVLYPMAPLYDAEKKQLQPKFTTALKRIFRLFDVDRDGVISRQELHEYQNVCFRTRMKPEDMDALLELVTLVKPDGVASEFRGLRFDGFAYLSELAIEKNKPEHCWQVLRTMGYSDTLELEVPLDHIELPQDTAQYEMCEPSAVTLQFLKAVFDQFAPLAPSTVDDIFAIVPPEKRPTWTTLPFEHQPHLDLSAWLSLWSLEMAVRPHRALEQLYYLGLVDVKASTAVEMRRSHASRRSTSNVIRCLLFGPPGCGKTLLTNSSTSFSFLSPEPLSMAFPDGDAKPIQAYQHLLHNVHTIVDKESGVEKTLIITEVSEGVVDYSMVEAIATAIQVDIVCYLFDGTEHDSFEYVGKLQACVSDTIPCVYAYSTPIPIDDGATSLLALDKCVRHCAQLKLHSPLSICLSTTAGFDALYGALVHRALHPHGALPFTEKKAAAKKLNDRLFYGGVVAVAAVAAGIAYMYADELQEVGFVKSIVQLWDQTKVKLPALKK
ncbi:hypothetical protein H310_11914 [Aphanomyces invadans]|uniref:EF-hand domain-containing protein n=1 Tax=Aphanomyces invadans TaxID=157072 RepID=A0A024TKU6_9STRA|nr:hypothetical protein H310_11914 [Aphanomyces invadans]ETV94236.1 hypothetical protein H310_11914 [Aphanomyces invadans]|eukprot:XP_008876998.1 hypothetical protein H310_11914 [Aphanomyces invadans]